MDTLRHIAYLHVMVYRLFFALVALLTGLAVEVNSVEARCLREPSMAVAALPESGVARSSRVPVGLAQLPAAGLRNARRHAPARPAPEAAPTVTTVQTRIDRARE